MKITGIFWFTNQNELVKMIEFMKFYELFQKKQLQNFYFVLNL